MLHSVSSQIIINILNLHLFTYKIQLNIDKGRVRCYSEENAVNIILR